MPALLTCQAYELTRDMGVQWPAVHGPVRPQNASLRLYGGAAFERCLDEFQEAAHVVQFPTGKHAPHTARQEASPFASYIAFVHKHIAVPSLQLFSRADLCWQLPVKCVSHIQQRSHH